MRNNGTISLAVRTSVKPYFFYICIRFHYNWTDLIKPFKIYACLHTFVVFLLLYLQKDIISFSV
jgi:hypothetical protein